MGAFDGGPSPRGWGKRCIGCMVTLPTRSIPTRVGKTLAKSISWNSTAVHPHAGGENLSARGSRLLQGGPSPRGWGKPKKRSSSAGFWRSIPTRVGKTAKPTLMVRPIPVHPHAGGENEFSSVTTTDETGPSPRGWGKLSLRRDPGSDPRSIPTRVGKTGSNSTTSWKSTVHPHAGGENLQTGHTAGPSDGPSPRGWGKQSWICCW